MINSAFIAEVNASRIRTIDALNEAWAAWCDDVYNLDVHGETGEAPRDRWRKGLPTVRFVSEVPLRQAFLWRELRTSDKAGVFSLFGTEYQVGAALARKAVEVRYDPENLAEIEVWHDGRMAERVTPFVVGRHRREHVEMPVPPPAPATPTGDWLGHLTDERRKKNFVEPTPQMLAEAAAQRRVEADAAVFDVLAARLDAAVVDAPTIRAFLARFGHGMPTGWPSSSTACSLTTHEISTSRSTSSSSTPSSRK